MPSPARYAGLPDVDELRRLASFRLSLRRFHASSDRVARRHGLTPRQHLILLTLAARERAGEETTVGDLASALELPPSTLSGLLERAEAAGLLTRRPAQHDARVAYVQGTEAGLQRLARTIDALARDRAALDIWNTQPVELHPQAQAVLEDMAALGHPPIVDVSPPEAREIRRAHVQPSATDIHDVRDVDAAGVPARLYRPSAEDGLGLLVYFHGGGWVVGDLDTHDATARLLAAESGHAVLSVHYRLAPEHPFPAAYDDAITVVRWVAEHATELGCDPEKLAIGGDSAGGNLSAAVAQLAPVPLRFQLLVYPVTDLRCNTSSYEDYCDGPYLTRASMDWYIDHYLSGDGVSADDPRVSPLLGDDAALAKSPPTYVVTVETDVLRDEGEAYAARLEAVGVPTTLRRYEGMFHGFFALPEQIDAGREAVAEAAQAFRNAVG